MKYGFITCSYMGRIYGDNKPETLDWGDMTRRHLTENGDDTLMGIARTARSMGLENIELWWGHSDYHTHGESEARELAESLGYDLEANETYVRPFIKQIFRLKEKDRG